MATDKGGGNRGAAEAVLLGRPWDKTVGKNREGDRSWRDRSGGGNIRGGRGKGGAWSRVVAGLRMVVPASGELGSGSSPRDFRYQPSLVDRVY